MLRFVFILSMIIYVFQVLDMFAIWSILKIKLSLSICKMNPTKSLVIQPFLSEKLVPKLLEENTRKQKMPESDASISHRSSNSGFVA